MSDIPLILLGFIESLWILLSDRPDVVFSKGGYAAVPPVYAAKLLRIPLIIHESDTSLGLANRLCAPCADVICLNTPHTLEFLNPSQQEKALVSLGFPHAPKERQVTHWMYIRRSLLTGSSRWSR